jgi:hypothetical protein
MILLVAGNTKVLSTKQFKHTKIAFFYIHSSLGGWNWKDYNIQYTAKYLYLLHMILCTGMFHLCAMLYGNLWAMYKFTPSVTLKQYMLCNILYKFPQNCASNMRVPAALCVGFLYGAWLCHWPAPNCETHSFYALPWVGWGQKGPQTCYMTALDKLQ